MTLSVRQQLRAEVFEIADDQCEHPAAGGRCPNRAVEMAHIVPRGMGHTGYRDTLGNVMAACYGHASSTDDLSSPQWLHVPDWQVSESQGTLAAPLMTKRQALAAYVLTRRRGEGWDV